MVLNIGILVIEIYLEFVICNLEFSTIMSLNIHSQQYKIPPDIAEFIEKTIGKIANRTQIIGAEVYLSRNTHHKKGNVFSIEIDLHVPRKIIRARVEGGEDVRGAIILAQEKLQKQLERYKAKKPHENRRS